MRTLETQTDILTIGTTKDKTMDDKELLETLTEQQQELERLYEYCASLSVRIWLAYACSFSSLLVVVFFQWVCAHETLPHLYS